MQGNISTHKAVRRQEEYTKYYGPKKPLLMYTLRSTLDFIGLNQPVEYYRASKRARFEFETLQCWRYFGLNSPKPLSLHANKIVMSAIFGETLDQLCQRTRKIEDNILKKLFLDLNKRHEIALKNDEPRLCHVDANLRNLILCEEKIYHIDFEMGREYETIDQWMLRELSKLLMSLLQSEPNKRRREITDIFVKFYTHQDEIQRLIDEQAGKNKSSHTFKLSDITQLIKESQQAV